MHYIYFDMSPTIFSSNMMLIQECIFSGKIIIMTYEVGFLIHFILYIWVDQLLTFCKCVFFFNHNPIVIQSILNARSEPGVDSYRESEIIVLTSNWQLKQESNVYVESN